MIVRLELDTARPEDRDLLALIFAREPGPAPVPPASVIEVPDALVRGRDLLRAVVQAAQSGARPSAALPVGGDLETLIAYVRACGGLTPAILAVFSDDGAGVSPAEEERRAAFAVGIALDLAQLPTQHPIWEVL